jgi:hypothetical protein
MLPPRRRQIAMSLWLWFTCALGIGLVSALESWAWMRHRMSAIALAATGTLSLGAALIAISIMVGIGYGVLSAVSGWDPAGWSTEETSSASAAGRSCDPTYRGECLDSNAVDYDCAGGSGNGPEYAGPVEVVGADPFGLDADGDGFGCE